jgi:DNA-binding NarL/FixJ family response regulator
MIPRYKLLITEDHAIVRVGLRVLLSKEPDLEVIGETDNGRDTIRMVDEFAPDLIMFDLNAHRTDGTGAIAEIRRRHPKTRIVVLSQQTTEENIREALRAGASGYVLKDASDAELIAAVHCVLAGRLYLSPGISDQVINAFLVGGTAGGAKTELDALTARERQILKLVAEGHTSKHIAGHLSLSVKTVEKHRSNLMKKLGLHNASALTSFAIGRGLVGAGN